MLLPLILDRDSDIYIVLTVAALLIVVIIFFIAFAVYFIVTIRKNKINPHRPDIYHRDSSILSAPPVSSKKNDNTKNANTDASDSDTIASTIDLTSRQNAGSKKVNNKHTYKNSKHDYDFEDDEIAQFSEEEYIDESMSSYPVVKNDNKKKKQIRKVLTPVSVFTVEESIVSEPVPLSQKKRVTTTYKKPIEKDRLKIAREVRRKSPDFETENF